jgi:hypothetical protein
VKAHNSERQEEEREKQEIKINIINNYPMWEVYKGIQ